ncbi:YczE/YyaS/YitT family protein [Propionibacteriaceae bacterium Y1685]|uniref:membrane protein YczE n=1 Tax=Microlunatus sp. Y1700 TaxID=3418487 RepID=UPI003B78E72C
MHGLANLSPRQQLLAGNLPRRLLQLALGLFLYGFSIAMLVQAHLGLGPWSVLEQGLLRLLPLSFGQVVVLVGAVVLLLWIPLRQWPGLGTVANVLAVGPALDFGLWVLPEPESLGMRIAFMVAGVVLNGVATAVYIGSQLGPGPRDGLMTGLAARTGRSLRLLRTGIEVTVLAIGFVLGGTVGVGTVLYALGIGPLAQFFLRWVVVPLPDVRPLGEPEPTPS